MAFSFENDSVSFTFPFGALVLSDLSSHINQVDCLLLSEDASRFQEMGVFTTHKNCFRETYQVIMWCLYSAFDSAFWYVILTFVFSVRS